MKKSYNSPWCEALMVDQSDVITTSVFKTFVKADENAQGDFEGGASIQFPF